MRWFLFLIICFLYSPSFAQNQEKHWGVEVSVGTDLGWWIYNRGFVAPRANNRFGRDYTHHSVTAATEIDVLYQVKKWTFGLGLSTSWLFEDQMIGQADSEFNFDRVDIADFAVRFQTYSAQIEYDLFSKKGYTFSPNFRYGLFDINTTHPDRASFGTKTFWELGFNQSIRLNRWELVLRPRYRLMTMQSENPQEDHKIYNIGVQVGLRFWLL